jgi:hypothetical protein
MEKFMAKKSTSKSAIGPEFRADHKHKRLIDRSLNPAASEDELGHQLNTSWIKPARWLTKAGAVDTRLDVIAGLTVKHVEDINT